MIRNMVSMVLMMIIFRNMVRVVLIIVMIRNMVSMVLMMIIFRNMVRVVHAFKPAKVAQSNDLDLETLPESFR